MKRFLFALIIALFAIGSTVALTHYFTDVFQKTEEPKAN